MTNKTPIWYVILIILVALASGLGALAAQGLQPIVFDQPVIFNGNVLFRGAVTATAVYPSGVYVGITPVATATPIVAGYVFTGPVNAQNITATVASFNSLSVVGTPVVWATPPGNVTATVAVASTFVANGTPVIPYSTPAVKSTAAAVGCVMWGGTITGTTTVTTHGFTTVVGADPWMAQAITGDAARPYSSVSGITVTLGVYNALQTPAANATGAAVKALICGY